MRNVFRKNKRKADDCGMTGKIGIIGDKNSVLGFMAAGFHVFSVETADEAKDILEGAINNGFAVMYVTEEIITEIPEVYEKFKTEPALAIIPLPSKSGAKGFGMANIKKSVERAVGADILKD